MARAARVRKGRNGAGGAGRVQVGVVVPFADGLLRSQELPAIIAECRPKGEHAAVEFTMLFRGGRDAGGGRQYGSLHGVALSLSCKVGNRVGKFFPKRIGLMIFHHKPLIFFWRAREESNPRPIA